MYQTYKPGGDTSASPYRIVNGSGRTIEYLKMVFRAVELQRVPGEWEKLMRAKVQIDDSVIMLADAVECWPAMSVQACAHVSDVDDCYRRAIDAGAETIQEPVTMHDAVSRAGVNEPGGTTYWIGTRGD